jgi:hypothetical protein
MSLPRLVIPAIDSDVHSRWHFAQVKCIFLSIMLFAPCTVLYMYSHLVQLRIVILITVVTRTWTLVPVFGTS